MKSAHQVAAIVATAIAARAVMALVIDPIPWRPADDLFYTGIARSLVEHGTYALDGQPTAYRPPGYPLFLAILYHISQAPLFIFAVQSALTIAAAILTNFRIDRLGFPTALAFAACPFFIVYEWRLLSEAIAVPLLWIGWLLLSQKKVRFEPVLGGICLGWAILARDTLLLLPAVAVALSALFWRETWKRTLTAALVAYLVVLPWPLRNSTLPDVGFSMGEGRIGYNLWIGTWERNPDWMLNGVAAADYPAYAFATAEERTAITEALRADPEATNDELFQRVAVSRILTDPLFVLTSWAARYPDLWLSTRSEHANFTAAREGAVWTAIKAFLFGLNALVLIGGLTGMLMKGPYRLFAVPVIYAALVYIPFHNTEARYSLPAVPFLLLFAVMALRRLAQLSPIIHTIGAPTAGQPMKQA